MTFIVRDCLEYFYGLCGVCRDDIVLEAICKKQGRDFKHEIVTCSLVKSGLAQRDGRRFALGQ